MNYGTSLAQAEAVLDAERKTTCFLPKTDLMTKRDDLVDGNYSPFGEEEKEKSGPDFFRQRGATLHTSETIRKLTGTDKILKPTRVELGSKVQAVSDEGGEWRSRVLVLVSTRLGLKKPSEALAQNIKKCFHFPQSVGLIGGRPNFAMYFVGYQGDRLILLDPHEVQEPAERFSDLPKRLCTFTCSEAKTLKIKKLDPCIAIGFFLRDRADFEDFVERSRLLGSGEESVFSIAKERPKSVDLSEISNLEF